MKRMICVWACALFTIAATGQRKSNETSLQDKMVTASVMTKSDVSINPNPVVSGNFSLVLQNLEKGKYQVFLYDTSGRRFLLKTLEFEGGSAVQVIELPEKARAGVYILRVVSKATRFCRKLIVE